METVHHMMARQTLTLVLAVSCLGGLVQPAVAASPTAAQPQPAPATVFRNVRIFDGKSSQLSAPSNVLVRGNRIERISATAIATEPGAQVSPLWGASHGSARDAVCLLQELSLFFTRLTGTADSAESEK